MFVVILSLDSITATVENAQQLPHCKNRAATHPGEMLQTWQLKSLKARLGAVTIKQTRLHLLPHRRNVDVSCHPK